MSRRLLAALGLIVLVLALGFAALQMLLLAPVPHSGAGFQVTKPAFAVLRSGDTVAVLQSEWRRVSWEMGRRPPQIEDREDD